MADANTTDTLDTDLAFAAMDAIINTTDAGKALLFTITTAIENVGSSAMSLWDLSRGQRSAARKLIRQGLVVEDAHEELCLTDLGRAVATATADEGGDAAVYAAELAMGK